MRKKDLYIIAITAIFAGLFSFILSSKIFGSPKTKPIKVPVVQPISSDFPNTQDETYKKIFNDQAINPTQLIHIGENNNTVPFNTQQ